MSRPEDLLPPDLFYNDTESAKYTTSSRIRQIQASMTNRALDLLNLSEPSFILDLGCGSGLSGEILGSAGHTWVGMDISPMQRHDRQLQDKANGHTDTDGMDSDDVSEDDSSEDDGGANGDLLLADMGQGLPFRPGAFDAAISISAIQWLCNVEDTSASSHSADARLRRFFDSLYVALKRGGKAVCQFYPKNDAQRTMISQAAVRAGFGAGILEDDGGTKNVKVYLVLSVGGGDITGVVEGWEGVDVEDGRRVREAKMKGGRNAAKKGGKAWVLGKKEKMRAKGKVVKDDSKYTGRRRGPKF
ncbi:18S rRNA (guanine1575-N7)-methyltransferase [Exophiala xenobiotica]|uniref:18S rRNA (Guanine1575-N7)-methyltransferase n=1 Tax=Lithohypha guttulata TaxID=1690604 RepID=A0ABR0KCU0_9EURO|nr:18S rRNA (guanine1575-N7)-methyltransferase [Lithohypha guttulata]KAK5320369.1 18S rRNA (guanine1575-N7)-methyltransferase [Exophiala xenobiotica]